METQTTLEGKKADEGKPPIDLVPSELVIEVAKILGFGAKKYAVHNWRAGIKWSRVYAAVQRHLLAWNSGEDNDPESGLPHLAHAACGLAFLLWYRRYRTKFDDRYYSVVEGQQSSRAGPEPGMLIQAKTVAELAEVHRQICAMHDSQEAKK